MVLADARAWETALAAARAGTSQVLMPVLAGTAPRAYWQATLQPMPPGGPQYLLLRFLDVSEQLMRYSQRV